MTPQDPWRTEPSRITARPHDTKPTCAKIFTVSPVIADPRPPVVVESRDEHAQFMLGVSSGLLAARNKLTLRDGPAGREELQLVIGHLLGFGSRLHERLPDATGDPQGSTDLRRRINGDLADTLSAVQAASENLMCVDSTLRRLDTASLIFDKTQRDAAVASIEEDIDEHLDSTHALLSQTAHEVTARVCALLEPDRATASRRTSAHRGQQADRALAQALLRAADDLRHHGDQVPRAEGEGPNHGALVAQATELAGIAAGLTAQLSVHAASAHLAPLPWTHAASDLATAAGNVGTAIAALMWADSNLYTLDTADHDLDPGTVTRVSGSEIVWHLRTAREQLEGAADSLIRRAGSLLAASCRTPTSRNPPALPTAAALLNVSNGLGPTPAPTGRR
ncbi:hypothetical protein [Streptacidiphilus sp. MAP5-52]|uniref:hypothetical protein n=1 Tax=Streptacidiphilus sp. MAP5-52 TaxID=3156267 RepID=UPI003510D9F3